MTRERFFRNFKLLLLASMAALALVVSACGKGFHAIQPQEDVELTGAKNKNGVPYTSAAETSELRALKASIDSSSTMNLDLARRIDGVRIARLDKDGGPTTSNPAQLEIQIVIRDLQPSPIAFRAVFSGHAQSATGVRSKTPRPDLSLDARCFDQDCDAVEVRLKLSGAVSGFIQRKRSAKLVALGPFDDQSKGTRLEKLAKAIQSKSDATLLTTEVAWGPAMFVLQAGDVSASGGIVQTGEQDEPVSLTLKGEGRFQAFLMGNNNRGDLLLNVTEGKSWSYLRVILPKSVTDDNDTPISEPGPSADRLINWDPNHPITRIFQKDMARPEMQAMVEHAKARTSGPQGLVGRWLDKFVNRVRPNVPLIGEILAKRGVPQEMIFITMIESDYFRAEGFPVRMSVIKGRAKNEGARGPWQFIPKTAAEYGLKLDPCDERGDLELSTDAAARKFAKLFKLYPHDPKLALVAYNWGQGNVKKAMTKSQATESEVSQKLEQLQTAGFDFWTLRELNTLPKESVNYTMNFLVAQYLGREPIRNGFAKDAVEYPVAPQACPRK